MLHVNIFSPASVEERKWLSLNKHFHVIMFGTSHRKAALFRVVSCSYGKLTGSDSTTRKSIGICGANTSTADFFLVCF